MIFMFLLLSCANFKLENKNKPYRMDRYGELEYIDSEEEWEDYVAQQEWNDYVDQEEWGRGMYSGEKKYNAAAVKLRDKKVSFDTSLLDIDILRLSESLKLNEDVFSIESIELFLGGSVKYDTFYDDHDSFGYGYEDHINVDKNVFTVDSGTITCKKGVIDNRSKKNSRERFIFRKLIQYLDNLNSYISYDKKTKLVNLIKKRGSIDLIKSLPFKYFSSSFSFLRGDFDERAEAIKQSDYIRKITQPYEGPSIGGRDKGNKPPARDEIMKVVAKLDFSFDDVMDCTFEILKKVSLDDFDFVFKRIADTRGLICDYEYSPISQLLFDAISLSEEVFYKIVECLERFTFEKEVLGSCCVNKRKSNSNTLLMAAIVNEKYDLACEILRLNRINPKIFSKSIVSNTEKNTLISLAFHSKSEKLKAEILQQMTSKDFSAALQIALSVPGNIESKEDIRYIIKGHEKDYIIFLISKADLLIDSSRKVGNLSYLDEDIFNYLWERVLKEKLYKKNNLLMHLNYGSCYELSAPMEFFFKNLDEIFGEENCEDINEYFEIAVKTDNREYQLLILSLLSADELLGIGSKITVEHILSLQDIFLSKLSLIDLCRLLSDKDFIKIKSILKEKIKRKSSTYTDDNADIGYGLISPNIVVLLAQNGIINKNILLNTKLNEDIFDLITINYEGRSEKDLRELLIELLIRGNYNEGFILDVLSNYPNTLNEKLEKPEEMEEYFDFYPSYTKIGDVLIDKTFFDDMKLFKIVFDNFSYVPKDDLFRKCLREKYYNRYSSKEIKEEEERKRWLCFLLEIKAKFDEEVDYFGMAVQNRVGHEIFKLIVDNISKPKTAINYIYNYLNHSEGTPICLDDLRYLMSINKNNYIDIKLFFRGRGGSYDIKEDIGNFSVPKYPEFQVIIEQLIFDNKRYTLTIGALFVWLLENGCYIKEDANVIEDYLQLCRSAAVDINFIKYLIDLDKRKERIILKRNYGLLSPGFKEGEEETFIKCKEIKRLLESNGYTIGLDKRDISYHALTKAMLPFVDVKLCYDCNLFADIFYNSDIVNKKGHFEVLVDNDCLINQLNSHKRREHFYMRFDRRSEISLEDRFALLSLGYSFASLKRVVQVERKKDSLQSTIITNPFLLLQLCNNWADEFVAKCFGRQSISDYYKLIFRQNNINLKKEDKDSLFSFILSRAIYRISKNNENYSDTYEIMKDFYSAVNIKRPLRSFLKKSEEGRLIKENIERLKKELIKSPLGDLCKELWQNSDEDKVEQFFDFIFKMMGIKETL